MSDIIPHDFVWMSDGGDLGDLLGGGEVGFLLPAGHDWKLT